jgi:hypothetical protein
VLDRRYAEGCGVAGHFSNETVNDSRDIQPLIASQVEGVLSARVYSDELPEPPEEFSAVTAIFTSSAVRAANPGFVFDPVAINTL